MFTQDYTPFRRKHKIFTADSTVTIVMNIGNKKECNALTKETLQTLTTVQRTCTHCKFHKGVFLLFPYLFHNYLFCSYHSRMLSDNPIETIEAEAFRVGVLHLSM